MPFLWGVGEGVVERGGKVMRMRGKERGQGTEKERGRERDRIRQRGRENVGKGERRAR